MADNKISTSRREIYTKMLDIAEKYTDIKNTDFLKTGLFGYMTETMAMMMRDSTFHKSMMYNESFLNTAILPKSVYNWAKMFNIEVQKASPKYAIINIVIPTSSLQNMLSTKVYTGAEREKYGLNSNDPVIVLKREDPILAGDYYFSLERSIKIYKKNTANSNNDIINASYSAEYIMTEPTTTNFESLTTNKLTTKIDNNNLIITARAYQYKTQTTISKITTTSFLNKIHKVIFEDQFCGVSLFYEEYDNSYVEIPVYYSDMKPPAGKRCAFYNLNDSNELELLFKHGDSYFMPSANTKLKICVYTTKAENAPLVYSGDALMLISDADLKTLPLLIQFNPSNLMGGKNQPDISTIKQTIIREISTRNVITTQSDLDNFFGILTSLIEDVNDGKIKFIKKRDDIVRRMFNTYLLLRDNIDDSKSVEITNTRALSQVVPTNTIDIKFGDDFFIERDENGIITNTGKKHKELSYSKFNEYTGKIIMDDILDDNYFICPFLISISTIEDENINYVKYIYNMTDSESTVYFTENNGINESFNSNGQNFYLIPEKVRLYRGFGEGSFESTDYYKLYLTTITNEAIGSCPDAEKILSYDGEIIIKEMIGSGTSLINYRAGITDIDVSSEMSEDGTYITTFEITLNTNEEEFNFVEGDSQTRYYNKILLNDGSVKAFNSSSNIQIDLSDFYINSIPVNAILQVSDKLVFFEHLDNYMDSTMLLNDNNVVIGLKDVPVIHSSFFERSNAVQEKRKENFVNQLFTYIEILKKNIDRLETSTFFNIKFYNTYGMSNLYTTDTVNIKLGLEIVFNKEEYLTNDSLKAEIRSYIRKTVDKMNQNESFNLTNLTAAVSNQNAYGKYIKYINFSGINSSFDQYIYRLSDRDEKDYTPEWLNIDYTSLDGSGDGDIITFAYK